MVAIRGYRAVHHGRPQTNDLTNIYSIFANANGCGSRCWALLPELLFESRLPFHFFTSLQRSNLACPALGPLAPWPTLACRGYESLSVSKAPRGAE